jgi:RHS repeat-associated protein
VLGQHVEQDVTQGGTTTVTKFAFDVSGHGWADLNGSNAIQTRRVSLDARDAVFARIGADGTEAWYLADHQGSIRGLVNNSGTLIDGMSYDAFGNISSESSPGNGDRFKLAGGEFNSNLGQYHFGQRWYDPANGRWTSQDPLGLGPDSNPYRYVVNDPTDRVDPTGLWSPVTGNVPAGVLSLALGAGMFSGGSRPTPAALISLMLANGIEVRPSYFPSAAPKPWYAGNFPAQILIGFSKVPGEVVNIAWDLYRTDVQLQSLIMNKIAGTPVYQFQLSSGLFGGAEQAAKQGQLGSYTGWQMLNSATFGLAGLAQSAVNGDWDSFAQQVGGMAWIPLTNAVAPKIWPGKPNGRPAPVAQVAEHSCFVAGTAILLPAMEAGADESAQTVGEEDAALWWVVIACGMIGLGGCQFLKPRCKGKHQGDQPNDPEDQDNEDPSDSWKSNSDPLAAGGEPSGTGPTWRAGNGPAETAIANLCSDQGTVCRMPSSASNPSSFPAKLIGRLWLVAWMLMSALGLWGIASKPNPTGPAGKDGTARSRVGTSFTTKTIESIRVGDRVWAHNPELSEADRQAPDPDPRAWRRLKLFLFKKDGRRVDMELLRPLHWLIAQGAVPGKQVWLDLPEMGCQGYAAVLKVGPCPHFNPGKGRVVTGTYVHEAAGNVVDLHLEGLTKPIGVTSNHPIYSVDRKRFVPAGYLTIGERVQPVSGPPTRVTAVIPRPVAQRVYNIEVHKEHVYHVSQLGVLVHNQSPLIVSGNYPAGSVTTWDVGATAPSGLPSLRPIVSPVRPPNLVQQWTAGNLPAPQYGATPAGRPFSWHYATESGPIRNLPVSLIDHVIDNHPPIAGRGGTVVYYDPVNDVTVVTGSAYGGSIVTAHRGLPYEIRQAN